MCPRCLEDGIARGCSGTIRTCPEYKRALGNPGPIYLVRDEEIIGIEHMWAEDMMPEVSIPTPAGPEVFNTSVPLPIGVMVDNVDVAFMPHGHEGFEISHWDIHLYFITQEERRELVPHEHQYRNF